MTLSLPRTAALGAVAALTLSALSACGAAPDDASTSADGKSAATATSAADFGGLDALVKAAKKEGTLNAIALPSPPARARTAPSTSSTSAAPSR